MKLIILEGIATSGKSVLGEKITGFLKDKNYEVYYFNDDIRNEFNIDILSPLKNKEDITIEKINEFLNKIVKKLDKEGKKKTIYVIDRFHFSYLSFLECNVEKFSKLEKEIREFTKLIYLGFENFNAEILHDRINKALVLRGENHGYKNYYKKLINENNGSKKEILYKHYIKRYERYKKAFKNSRLDKIFIPIDKIILKEEYNKVLDEIKKEILDFASDL